MSGEENKKDKPSYLTANARAYKTLRSNQKELKQNYTNAERLIWQYLKTKQTGYRFRRQHIIDVYIVDFVCLTEKLIVEIDGKIHLNQINYDKERTDQLNILGFNVLRFTNEEVLESPATVAMQIKDYLESNKSQT